MVGGGTVPAAVAGLERLVVPVVAGVLAADHRPRAVDSLGPEVRRPGMGDAPRDPSWRTAATRRPLRRVEARILQLHPGIGAHPTHVVAPGHGLGGRDVAPHPDHVGDPERPCLDVQRRERREHRRLFHGRRLPQALEDEAALGLLGPQTFGGTQVRLGLQYHQELGRALPRRRLQHPRVDLASPVGLVGAGGSSRGEEQKHSSTEQRGVVEIRHRLAPGVDDSPAGVEASQYTVLFV